MSVEAREFVKDVLARLTQTEGIQRQRFFYKLGESRFGPAWRFADILTTLRAACILVPPTTYLEIGVFGGRSSAVVAAGAPHCAIYGFDLWAETYQSLQNPGRDFAREQILAAGHHGELVLTPGDSRETVPAFLGAEPALFFDLINVDGDHSVRGAAIDLANVMPRLKVGGMLVFDDIRSAPNLQRVWKRLVRDDPRFVTWQYTEAGTGIAGAVRVRA
jgi:predicted O-methyltransferase YrrM